MSRPTIAPVRPWAVVLLIVAFFIFAGTAVAATATALAAISQSERYSAVAIASFLLVCGVAFLCLRCGVPPRRLFAVAGRGVSRLLLAGASFALGFGAVQAWSPSAPLTSVLAPAGLIGFFWVLASFPGVRPNPPWLRWAVVWLAVWSCVCFGIPPVREAIASGTDPWISLVGPGFLAGLAAIVVGKALDFHRTETATRRWYLALGVVVVLSMIGAGISAVLRDRLVLLGTEIGNPGGSPDRLRSRGSRFSTSSRHSPMLMALP